MTKKLLTLVITLLASARCSEFRRQPSESSDESSTGKEPLTSDVIISEDDSVVVSEYPEQSTEETSIPPVSVDEFDGLSSDARKVAMALKNESRDAVSYFKMTVSVQAGGITVIRQFAYHFAEQLFATYGELIDDEDNVIFNGYVIFEWGHFFDGYFGGNYQKDNYKIEDVHFFEFYGTGFDLDLDWARATYGETNFPDASDDTKMIERIDLAFNTLLLGVDYAEEYLQTSFNPPLSLI